jgi:hypothetical protein
MQLVSLHKRVQVYLYQFGVHASSLLPKQSIGHINHCLLCLKIMLLIVTAILVDRFA